jgi:hypothetical protein
MLNKLFVHMVTEYVEWPINLMAFFTVLDSKIPKNLRQYYADKLALMYYEVASGK